jgi:MFS family permease
MIRLNDPARLRRIILWGMLGALGLSGVLATVGVLGNSYEYTWSAITTGLAALVACGLLFAAGRLLDSEKSRSAGLFMMALVIVEFGFVLLATWCPLIFFSATPYRSREIFVEIAASFVPIAVVLALFSYVRNRRGGKLAAIVGGASTLVAFIIFLIAIISPDNAAMIAGRIWGTGWAYWFFALVAGANLAAAVRRPWRWIGIAAAVAALLLGIRNIWSDEPDYINAYAILITAAILGGLINLLWLGTLKAGQKWLRVFAAACGVCAGILIDFSVIAQEYANEPAARIGTALAVCAVCASLAVAILMIFNRRPAPASETDIDAPEISILCPTCRRKQNIALTHGFGETSCPGCGMIFSIRIRAPRCSSCNYVLLMFHGDRCPECGAAVKSQHTPPLVSAAAASEPTV